MAPALGFLVVGDWGMPDRREQAVAVATQMGRVAERLAARFVISTGDNFYRNGVESVTDPLWQSAFESVYTAPALDCPWYPVLGNHDHRGNDQAEIDYAGRSPRWRMPARFYRNGEVLEDGTGADFFFLDTDPIARLGWADRWLPAGTRVRRQLGWLEEGLATSEARWKIVVGHHPIFSGGRHGGTPQMVELVKPLLDRHGVKAYISGHDHDLQHIVVEGVHYLTSGAGSDHRPTAPIAGTRYAGDTLGFLAARLRSDEMAFDFVDGSGRTVYSSTITA